MSFFKFNFVRNSCKKEEECGDDFCGALEAGNHGKNDENDKNPKKSKGSKRRKFSNRGSAYHRTAQSAADRRTEALHAAVWPRDNLEEFILALDQHPDELDKKFSKMEDTLLHR